MRKVLLATTALGMGAGVAFAQDAMMDMGPSITLSGDAEIGVAGSQDDSARFHTDVNVEFKMEGTTDAGITFGTSVGLNDIEDPGAGASGRTVNDTTNTDDRPGAIAIYMKGPFGNLNLGDTDGAFDWALAETNGVGGGSIRDSEEHGGFTGNSGLDGTHDGQILRYDIGFSGFGFAASIEFDDDVSSGDIDAATAGTQRAAGAQVGDSDNTVIGVGATYGMTMQNGSSLGFGIGYQDGGRTAYIDNPATPANEGAGGNAVVTALGDTAAGAGATKGNAANQDRNIVGASVNFDAGNGLKAIANYSRQQEDAVGTTGTPIANRFTDDSTTTRVGFGIGYSMEKMAIGVNVGSSVNERSFDSNGAATGGVSTEETTTRGVGLAASYDLGGGAKLMFGVGNSTTELDRPDGGIAVAPGTGVVGTNDAGTARDRREMESTNWSLGVKFAF